MDEKRYSGTALLLIMGLLGLATFGLLMYHLFESDKNLPENVKTLNSLHSEKTKACYRSIDTERCEAASKALKDYLDKNRNKMPEENK